MLTHDLGLDLGTANTSVYVSGKGVVIREPTVVSRHKKSKVVISMGTEAKKMIGKTPAMIEAVRPVVSGVIADFDAAEAMVGAYFKQVHNEGGVIPKVPRPRVVVAIPSGVTDVERRAVTDVVASAGARKVYLVEQPMAAAIGAGLSVEDSSGILIVSIGAGRSEVAVISLGGIVIHRSIKTAGETMDHAIVNYLRLKHALLLGDQTAEELKVKLGGGSDEEEKEGGRGRGGVMIVRGRSLETGLPASIKVTEAEIREAIAPVVHEIISSIVGLIEDTPPELVTDIVEKGVVLCGGVARLPGLDKIIADEVKLPTWVAEDPQTCVVRGCGKAWDDEKLLEKIRVTGGLR